MEVTVIRLSRKTVAIQWLKEDGSQIIRMEAELECV